MAGLDIQLDSAGVVRLIRTLLWIGTLEGPLAPERAGLIQALASRLGLDMAGVAELSKSPVFEAPPARAEAEATYLASMVLLAQTPTVTATERARLEELGTQLELGLAKPQLHALARSPAPLAGFRGDGSIVDVDPSESSRKKAGERLRARSKKRRGTSGTHPAAPAALDALADKDSAPGGPAGKRVAVAGLLLIALLVAGVAAVVALGGGEGDDPRAKTAFERQLDGWRTDVATGPDKSLEALKAIQRQVEHGATSEEATRAAQAFYASPEWKRAWTDATSIYEDQVRDELLLAAQEGRLADAAGILSSIPPEFARGGASWPARLQDELDAWLGFSRDVELLIGRSDVTAGSADAVAQIESGFALRKRGLACQAQPTQAFGELGEWFKAQWKSADAIQAKATEHIRARDASGLRRYGQILLLMGRPARAYGERLARETKSMALLAVATGNYTSAREFLSGLPTEYVPESWVKKRSAELERWEAFAASVKRVTTTTPLTADVLLEARDLFMEPGDATITPEYSTLATWFLAQKEAGKAIAWTEWRKSITLDDKPTGSRWGEVMYLLLGDELGEFLRTQMSEEFPELAELYEGYQPGASSGTGFYVTPTQILTNHHVIDGHTEVSIQAGGEEHLGKVIASDPELDLAIVETATPGTPIVGFSPNSQPGTLVFAFGFGTLAGESKTLLVTRGAISAKLVEQKRIVFDATINPGNSGGPMVDAEGRLLGVVVAKSASEEWVDSLAYAVDGSAVVAWLKAQGIELKTFADEVSSQTPPKNVDGAVVRLVVGGTLPGAKDEPPAKEPPGD